ncbi:hybrid sensor histidine kinase/response regulator [Mesorhizobium sp.]|uniref:ATP-binding response regulator n=1 Tax=Mesorhizobium sp. TaxID=1871066 RepID=UPI0025BF3B3C|nr:hybrid sensor histidine kinase/response regulator [Mesorhizobium sp.]
MTPPNGPSAAVLKLLGAMRGDRQDPDTERGQALVRLIIVGIVALYIIFEVLAARMPLNRAGLALLAYMGFSVIFSVSVYLAILRAPGPNHPRRWLGMAHDYIGITFTMAIGGKILLPVYSVLLWVTVGNGLRYGPNYLAAATCLALLSLSASAYISPYWRENPYLVATLVVTAIIVPAYAYLLLTQIRQARDEAAAANRAKSSLLAQASHDLRQPVHAISLFTACLRDSNLAAEEWKMVDNIDKSLQSVSRLFRSLLDVSTLDSGRVTPRMEVVAIGEVLDDVIRLNSEAARWANVTLQSVATEAFVRIDPILIATMVQNVVSNALKYARGRPVLIGCRRRGASLAIEVHDRGQGISERHLPKVFDEFYRAGDQGMDGVGLGLSIVKRLADLMRLEISIESRPGRGTVVKIAGLEMVKTDHHRASPNRSRPLTMLDGLRVVLIDDDKDVLLATATLLEKWGCMVQPETSMPSADTSCDLIVTDFELDGGRTGLQCIDFLRRSNGRWIPAVIMTGHDIKIVIEALSGEDIPILSKPVRPAELRSAVMAQKLNAKGGGLSASNLANP